jgi:hypothetical protein
MGLVPTDTAFRHGRARIVIAGHLHLHFGYTGRSSSHEQRAPVLHKSADIIEGLEALYYKSEGRGFETR